MKPETQMSLKQIIKLGDTVNVATEELKTQFSGLNNDIMVIRNSHDNDLFEINEVKGRRSNVILWRGTQSHREDLSEIGEQYLGAIRANPQYDFQFWGFKPEFAYFPDTRKGREDTPANLHCFGPTDIVEYFHRLKAVRPRIVVVPLKDNAFNHCKSNCAWLEATLAGAIVVAPNWPEWKHNGVLNYDGPEDFGRVLQNAIVTSDKAIEEINAKAVFEIQQNNMLYVSNKIRYEQLFG